MYNPKTFFKNTYCRFELASFNFSDVKTLKSKSGSIYHYTSDGVYRYANHWGRVANCRWELVNVTDYKNQNWYVGYAKWTDFYDLQSNDKSFFLQVVNEKVVIINNDTHLAYNHKNTLFSLQKAIQRKKEIEQVINNEDWAKYISLPITQARLIMRNKLTTSTKTFQQIKRELLQSDF